jgi:hypothetical protein
MITNPEWSLLGAYSSWWSGQQLQEIHFGTGTSQAEYTYQKPDSSRYGTYVGDIVNDRGIVVTVSMPMDPSMGIEAAQARALPYANVISGAFVHTETPQEMAAVHASWLENAQQYRPTMPGADVYYVPKGAYAQIQVPGQAVLNPTTGEFGIYQHVYDPNTGRDLSAAWASGTTGMIQVSGAGRYGLQSGMFSEIPHTPLIYAQGGDFSQRLSVPGMTGGDTLAQMVAKGTAGEAYSRLGAEAYKGYVQPLDARVLGVGAQVSVYPDETFNMAAYLTPLGLTSPGKMEAPGVIFPDVLDTTAIGRAGIVNQPGAMYTNPFVGAPGTILTIGMEGMSAIQARYVNEVAQPYVPINFPELKPLEYTPASPPIPMVFSSMVGGVSLNIPTQKIGEIAQPYVAIQFPDIAPIEKTPFPKSTIPIQYSPSVYPISSPQLPTSTLTPKEQAVQNLTPTSGTLANPDPLTVIANAIGSQYNKLFGSKIGSGTSVPAPVVVGGMAPMGIMGMSLEGGAVAPSGGGYAPEDVSPGGGGSYFDQVSDWVTSALGVPRASGAELGQTAAQQYMAPQTETTVMGTATQTTQQSLYGSIVSPISSGLEGVNEWIRSKLNLPSPAVGEQYVEYASLTNPFAYPMVMTSLFTQAINPSAAAIPQTFEPLRGQYTMFYEQPILMPSSLAVGAGMGTIWEGVSGLYGVARAGAAEEIISSGQTARAAEWFSGTIMENAPKVMTAIYGAGLFLESTQGGKNFNPEYVIPTAKGYVVQQAVPMGLGFGLPGQGIEAARLSDINYKSALQEGFTSGRLDYYLTQPVTEPFRAMNIEYLGLKQEGAVSGVGEYLEYKASLPGQWLLARVEGLFVGGEPISSAPFENVPIGAGTRPSLYGGGSRIGTRVVGGVEVSGLVPEDSLKSMGIDTSTGFRPPRGGAGEMQAAGDLFVMSEQLPAIDQVFAPRGQAPVMAPLFSVGVLQPQFQLTQTEITQRQETALLPDIGIDVLTGQRSQQMTTTMQAQRTIPQFQTSLSQAFQQYQEQQDRQAQIIAPSQLSMVMQQSSIEQMSKSFTDQMTRSGTMQIPRQLQIQTPQQIPATTPWNFPTQIPFMFPPLPLSGGGGGGGGIFRRWGKFTDILSLNVPGLRMPKTPMVKRSLKHEKKARRGKKK